MKQLSTILLYLDKSDILSAIKLSCDNYLAGLTENVYLKFPPFRFTMEFDVLDMIDYNNDVGTWLFREPVRFKQACSNILYACVQAVNRDNKPVEPAQVAADVRFKCVPRHVKQNPRYYRGLTTFSGLLLSVSKPESYVYHTVWSCPEECDGNEVILHYIPKLPPKCYVCKSVLFENSGLRRCSERVMGTFKLKDSFVSKRFPIVEDLIPKLKLGAIYNIHVIAIKKTISVWGLEEVVPLPAPVTASIPADIDELYTSCKGIPWQFISCLASSIGVNVCPLHCFMHVKISLLLSLASIRANAQTGSSIVHVLVAGYDSGYVGQLMERGARLAERAVFLGTSKADTDAATALIASTSGVCVMSLPLHVYNQKLMCAVLSSIETGELVTDTTKVKLQSAIWAQGMDFKKITIMNIGSVFGMVCRGDYGENTDEIADFLLQNAVEPNERNEDEERALRYVMNYIDLVGGMSVCLETGTERLLRNYFLAARRERAGAAGAGLLGALAASCQVISRLCRRRAASIEDAVFAIWLHVCGGPEPRFAPDEYLQTASDVKKLHKMMESFKHWLEQFTGSYLS